MGKPLPNVSDGNRLFVGHFILFDFPQFPISINCGFSDLGCKLQFGEKVKRLFPPLQQVNNHYWSKLYGVRGVTFVPELT